MPSFYTGDELGNIKHISCSRVIHNENDKPGDGSQWKLDDRIVVKANNSPDSTSKDYAVQKIASAELSSTKTVRPPSLMGDVLVY